MFYTILKYLWVLSWNVKNICNCTSTSFSKYQSCFMRPLPGQRDTQEREQVRKKTDTSSVSIPPGRWAEATGASAGDPGLTGAPPGLRAAHRCDTPCAGLLGSGAPSRRHAGRSLRGNCKRQSHISENQKQSSCHTTVFAVPLFLLSKPKLQRNKQSSALYNSHSDNTCALQAAGRDLLMGAAVLS